MADTEKEAAEEAKAEAPEAEAKTEPKAKKAPKAKAPAAEPKADEAEAEAETPAADGDVPKKEKSSKKEKSPSKEKAPAKGKGGKAGKGDAKGGKKSKKKGPQVAMERVKRTVAPRLAQRFKDEMVGALKKEFNFSNVMQVPKLKKITVNMGLGEAILNPKLIDMALEQMTVISGQRPVITKAKRSIATFKLREGMKIGVSVTLRREMMYEFFDRLVSFALPRVRDFKGVSPKAFDGRGNYTLGVKEQIVFPEIDYDTIEKIKGLNITFVTSAKTDEEGRALLRIMGMPFRK